jgi:hypothetical protein
MRSGSIAATSPVWPSCSLTASAADHHQRALSGAFERVEGSWRFATRYMILDQLGDLRQHLLLDAEAMTRS